MITQTNTRQVEPDVTVMEITGGLNLGNTLISVEGAIQRLIQDGVRKLVLDLAGLSYIDSAVIGTIVMCAGQMGQFGGRLRVSGAQGAVARAFGIVRLKQVVPQDSDVKPLARPLARPAAAPVCSW